MHIIRKFVVLYEKKKTIFNIYLLTIWVSRGIVALSQNEISSKSFDITMMKCGRTCDTIYGAI